MAAEARSNDHAVSPSDPFLHVEIDDSDALSTMSCSSVSTMAASTNSTHSVLVPPQDPWIDRSRIRYGISLQSIGQQSSISFSRKAIATMRESTWVEHASTSDAILFSTGSSKENDFFGLGFSRQAAQDAYHWSQILYGSTKDDKVPVIFVTDRRNYTKVVVTADLEDLEPNPDFVMAVTNAVTLPTREEQSEALTRALKRWGALVATRIELGCARISTFTFSTLATDGLPFDAHDRKTQLRAEDLVRDAARQSDKVTSGSNQIIDAARGRDSKIVGGTMEMKLEEPEAWSIIGVPSVHSSLELLREMYKDVHSKACEVVNYLEARLYAKSRPPMLHFPGRLVSYKYHNREATHLTGYVQLDLPGFDPSKNFTMSSWVLGGNQGGNAVPLSIECIEESRSLVALGSWEREDIFKVVRRTSRAPVLKNSPVETLIASHVKFKQEEWIHVAYMEHGGRMLLYMNGVMAASGSLPTIDHDTVTRIRLCIGRASWGYTMCDQWDGAIENVKVWDRALPAAEIEGEADFLHRPAPGGWGKPRYS